MTPEALKTELYLSVDAGLQSDDQVRQMPALIDKASKPNAEITPSDCAKLIAAALSVNARLHDSTARLRKELALAEWHVAKGLKG